MKPLSPNPPREPHLSFMPISVMKQIVSYVELPSLISLSRISRRFTAIKDWDEYRETKFLQGPSAPQAPLVPLTRPIRAETLEIDFIHPVFCRLFFAPTNHPSAVRIGLKTSQFFLGSNSVRNSFATRPAVKSLVFRIIGLKNANDNRWNVSFTVENQTGVTVWNVIKKLTAL